jgi:hypothetical protein
VIAAIPHKRSVSDVYFTWFYRVIQPWFILTEKTFMIFE